MRSLIVSLLILQLVHSASSVAAEMVSPAERADIDAFIARVISAGFPDGKLVHLFHGSLQVTATSGPKGEEPLLPCDASQMQETTATGVAYRFTFPGLHAKTPDGAWLIGFKYRYKPRPTDTVIETGLTAVNPATLTDESIIAHPFKAVEKAAEWLALDSDVDRPFVAAAMDRLVPVSYHLQVNTQNWSAAVVLLARAGWPDAAAGCLTIADLRAREFWQLRAWSEPDIAFDPTCTYPQARNDEQTWKAAHKTVTLEPPATALRRALYRFCRGQIMYEERWMSAADAATCCLACCDPGDPQGNRARIVALLAASALPITVPADAPLATRLASWEAAPRRPRMTVHAGAQGQSNTISTAFTAPPPSYEPTRADCDDLVSLLDDTRPSRWLDFSGIRSIGDNAWRALAIIVHRDPRLLAGYPTDRIWTASERHQAAVAFQLWWKDHRTTIPDPPPPAASTPTDPPHQ